MKSRISFYLSHDASIAIELPNNQYRIYELERFTNERYFLAFANPNLEHYLKEIKDIIEKEYPGIFFTEGLIVKHTTESLENIKSLLSKIFSINEFRFVGHHISHAACAFYTSKFDESIIVSFDGGGIELDNSVEYFNIFYANKINNDFTKIYSSNIDLANAYTFMALPIKEIKKGNYLSYAGKLMGLCAYGKIVPEWIHHIESYYLNTINNGKEAERLKLLGEKIGLPNLHVLDSIEEKIAYDLAATNQYVFEKLSFSLILPIVKRYNLPVCLSGGCALNVLFNESLRRLINNNIFIPPNPNDCGLAFGALVYTNPPSAEVDIKYSGFDFIDKSKLEYYKKTYKNKKTNAKQIAKLIVEGKIIGVARGLSECGPRALGNRSIICDPSISNMKEKLNAKVKFREWFRPFAPMVRLQDLNKYFDTDGSCEYMGFAPFIRKEWKEKIPSAVHEDSTTRVQSITKESNEFMFSILDEMEKLGHIPIILNTSFNIKGKPILTRFEDAINVLTETEIDYVVLDDYIFE
jgi:carbamoyltransferase